MVFLIWLWQKEIQVILKNRLYCFLALTFDSPMKIKSRSKKQYKRFLRIPWRNQQVKFDLKLVLKFWDMEICFHKILTVGPISKSYLNQWNVIIYFHYWISSKCQNISSSIFQNSETTIDSTETNNTSYGAERTRVWQYHECAAHTLP